MKTPIKRWELYLELFIELALIVVAVLCICVLLPKLLAFMWPFVVAWIIAMIGSPICKFLEKKLKISKKFGSAMIMILVICIVGGVLYLIILKIGKEAIAFGASLPNVAEDVGGAMNDLLKKLHIQNVNVPDEIRTSFQNLFADLDTKVGIMIENIGKNSVTYASKFASNVSSALIGIIVTIIASYFFIADREELVARCKKVMPISLQRKAGVVKKSLSDAIGGYVIAQLKMMVITFVILLIGLIIVQSDYVLLLALLISLIDMLPIFGAGIVLVPWAIYSIVQGHYWMAIGLLIIQTACFLSRQVLQPKIIGDSVGLSPLLTLVLLYVGLKLGGIIGFLLAMVIGIVLLNFYRAGMFEEKKKRIVRLLELIREANKELMG